LNQVKSCTKCGKTKKLEEFYRRPASLDGRTSWCGECCRNANREYRRANAESLKEQWKKYREENRKKTRAASRKYRKENREKVLAARRSHYKSHQKELSEDGRWRIRLRRAQKAGLPATLTKEQWTEICAEWRQRCAYCGIQESKLPEVLHQERIVPASQGGGYTASNVVPACRSCNSHKGARTPEEANMEFWPTI